MPVNKITKKDDTLGIGYGPTWAGIKVDTTDLTLQYNADGTVRTCVSLELNQTITGVKTFSAAPVMTGGLSFTGTSNVTLTDTITSATPATRRAIYSKITMTPSTTTAVGSGGSITAVRGEVNFTTGKTFTDGFLYGAQGKMIFAGTMAEAAAARLTGVLGQTDITGITLTAGQVSAVWADLQGSGMTLTVNDQVFPLRVTNSMNAACQALALFYGSADFALEFGEPATGFILSSGVSSGSPGYDGGAAKCLKVNIGGTTGYIPVHTANS